MASMLESAEAARRLGVKLPTLYAYVSRGLLVSHRSADGRRSQFRVEDVETLARRSRGARSSDMRLATVTTSITQLRPDGPAYRGEPAATLATRVTFEQVAEHLWGATSTAPPPWRPVPVAVPAPLAPTHRLRLAVVLAAADDPLRADLRPVAVANVARRLLATMVAVLPGADGTAAPLVLGRRPHGHTLAGTLARRLLPHPPRPGEVRALNAILVLLADHELAVSTMAVRVAASARADPYDAVLAGLGALGGPLHGGASRLALGLLREAARVGPGAAVDDALRFQGRLPGFGHSVYTTVDPRFGVLAELLGGIGTARDRQVLSALLALVEERGLGAPNIDLGLAALVALLGLADDAGEVLFTLARLAGWIAHYLEELGEAPLRYRARAVYAAGPGPEVRSASGDGRE